MAKERRNGRITVEEAGRLGGEKTFATRGREFYSEIGRKGGRRVSRLIQEGKAREKELTLNG